MTHIKIPLELQGCNGSRTYYWLVKGLTVALLQKLDTVVQLIFLEKRAKSLKRAKKRKV